MSGVSTLSTRKKTYHCPLQVFTQLCWGASPTESKALRNWLETAPSDSTKNICKNRQLNFGAKREHPFSPTSLTSRSPNQSPRTTVCKQTQPLNKPTTPGSESRMLSLNLRSTQKRKSSSTSPSTTRKRKRKRRKYEKTSTFYGVFI